MNPPEGGNECPKGSKPSFQKLALVFTNGTAIIQGQGLEALGYQCIDTYEPLHLPAVMTCQKIGPTCPDEQKTCVPKCCPEEEIFDVDNMR